MQLLKGTGVALVTPFDSTLSIDFDALGRLLRHVEAGNVDYLVALGTTAETSTLSTKEKLSLLNFIQSNSDLPLVVGHGGNSTQHLIDELPNFSNFNIKALLSVVPYYNRPSQIGLRRHYESIADASEWPIIMYNVPSRTASNLAADTAIQLASHDNIIAVKEASGDLNQIKEIINKTSKSFSVLSGDDGMTTEIIAAGGVGVISVIANYKPAQFCEMVHYAIEGQMTRAQEINKLLKEDFQLLTSEGNPTSVKTALESVGLMMRHVRLPLVDGSKELIKKFA